MLPGTRRHGEGFPAEGPDSKALSTFERKPLAGEIRLEGRSRWVAGSQEGFAALLEAIRDTEAMNLAR